AVVVSLLDRVEFVIVAAGAAEGDAEERRRGRVGDVVEDLLAPLLDVDGVVLVGWVPEEAGRNQGIGVARRDLVAGELFLDEAIIGLVAVEGADDVIAVAPGIGSRVVGLETVALGVAGEVKPPRCLALSVLRGTQQAIDEPLVGV